MRLGLPALKEGAAPQHPVQMIQESHRQESQQANKLQMLKNLYGVAAPAKLQIETQILGRFQRLPGGLHSSKLGLESLTGALDEFTFESFLGQPEYSTDLPVDLHSQMEQALHLGTKPCTRGL